MKFRKVLSLFAATAMAVSSFAGLATTASAADSTDIESVTYTWDFTDSEYFASSINAGKTIVSDQGEATAIMSNPGSKFSHTPGKATNAAGESVQVVKTAVVEKVMQLDIPDGASATLDIELTAGSSNRVISLSDATGNVVLSASDYTKNVLKTYTCNLDCNTTYYLDSAEYAAYIGKVALTVYAGEKEPEEPKESVAYTWDFTNSEYFASSINAGKTIVSDQGEATAIMSNPGSKFSHTPGKATNAAGESVQVVKTAVVEKVMQLDIPDGASATLDIELTAGSSGRVISLSDAEGNVVLSASDYTKNVLKTYTCDLNCNTTYYLDSAEYAAYIGKVVLTVYPVVEEPEVPAEIDVTIDVLGTYDNGYEGAATALTATLDVPAELTYDTVTVAMADGSASVTKTSEADGITVVSGGTIVYGIIVNAIVEAAALTVVAE